MPTTPNANLRPFKTQTPVVGFLSLFGFLFFALSFTVASAETVATVEIRKQQAVERALEYERLAITGTPSDYMQFSLLTFMIRLGSTPDYERHYAGVSSLKGRGRETSLKASDRET